MRLIDADVAKKAVHEEFDECLVWDESGEYTSNVIDEILEALPTVEAEPIRHGEWLTIIEANEYGEPYQSGVYCSECGETSIYEPNYCPNCGARMDGAERKEE